MADRIKVLVADGDPEALRHAVERLGAAPGIDVVGSAASGPRAVEAVPVLRPDVALIDLELPDQDGVRTTETITARYPWVSVVMTSTEANPDHLRRAMLAGARHYLIKPVPDDELVGSIEQVYRLDAGRRAAQAAAAPAAVAAPSPAGATGTREGKIFTFYSAKGGVGTTTIACNLAVALKQLTGKEVAIFDCGLLFGDVGVVLNLNPQKSILDLVPVLSATTSTPDADLLGSVMTTHHSGVKVLLAPTSPEKADLVTPEHVRRLLAALREHFDYVVIDTWPTFEERILNVLDDSDKIVVPTTVEMPAIKNSKLLMDVTSALSYPPEKIVLVLNRADSRGGIQVRDVEQILQKRFVAEIVSDGRLTTHSLNEGVPFVMTNPAAPISVNVAELARKLAGITSPVRDETRPQAKPSWFRAVLGAPGRT